MVFCQCGMLVVNSRMSLIVCSVHDENRVKFSKVVIFSELIDGSGVFFDS